MRRLLHHKLGIILSLAVIGAVALAGVSFTSSLASSPTAQTVASPAMPATQLPVPGFTEVAKAVTPAVVNITTSMGDRGDEWRGQRDRMRERMEEFFGSPWGPFGSPWGPRMPQDQPEHRRSGMGSGVIVTPDGHISTNNHVIDGARELTVTLPDKREFKGKVIGTDPKTDLALIKVEARDLPYVAWGDSTRLQVGEYVLAVGNPFGLNSTVTLGIVSALGRGRMGITQYEDFIQTDAAINPGNSGGALVNARGELIGINTAIFSQSGGYMGIGFAVPSNMVRSVMDQLIKGGKVVRGYLGVSIQELTQDLAKQFGVAETRGVLISDVLADSPAKRAKMERGDVILEFDGRIVENPTQFSNLVAQTPIGKKVHVKLIRNGQTKELDVTIAEQPKTMAQAESPGDGNQEAGSSGAFAGVDVCELTP